MPIGRRPSLVARDDEGLEHFQRLTETEDARELVLRFEQYHPLPPATQAAGLTSLQAERYILTALALGIRQLPVEEEHRLAFEKRFEVGDAAFSSFHLTVRSIERIGEQWGPDAWFRLRDEGVLLPVLAPTKRVYEKLATIAQHLTLTEFARQFRDAWPALIRGRRLEHQADRAIQHEDLRLFYERHIVPGP